MDKCVATLLRTCGAEILWIAGVGAAAAPPEIIGLRSNGGIDKTGMACQDAEMNTELIDTSL